MTFIGMISDCKSFEAIKEYLEEASEFKVIHINKKSISNIKNIRFETIIIDEDLNKLEQEKNIVKRLCKFAKKVLINTDINLSCEELESYNKDIITYGLNQKAIVTVSSITETNILVYLQKSLETRQGKMIEVGEQLIEIEENKKLKVYEILIMYIIFLINNKPIIEQTQEKSNFFK